MSKSTEQLLSPSRGRILCSNRSFIDGRARRSPASLKSNSASYFASAIFENHLAAYDPSLHRSLAFAFGQDPRVSCLVNYACLKCITGEPDEGLAMSCQAIAYAQELNHASTRAYAECFALQVLQFADK